MDDYSFLKPIVSPSVLSSASKLNSTTLSQTVDATSNSTSSEFKELLSLMLMGLNSSRLSAFGLGSEDSSESSWGFSSNWMMMPLMMTLFEKLLQLETQSQVSGNGGGKTAALSQEASQLHINQFEAEQALGGNGVNADCGPTSLVIALHALDLKVKGEGSNTDASQAVDLARQVMATDPSRDGIDENGLRSDSEHNAFTTFSDLLKGAKESGAKATLIIPNAGNIQAALEKGAKVIVSGTFVGKEPLPWYGDRGADESSAPGFSTQHIVAVTGFDSKTNTFIVNDPARNTPLQVDGKTLEYFMEGNRGAMSLAK